MEIVIAKDQPMEYQPRAKTIYKGYVKRHDFLVKCRPQRVVLKEGQDNPLTRSEMRQLEDLTGKMRVFMGPSSYYSDQNTYSCGLWVRDHGTFLKKVFGIVEKDRAKLFATVKHHGETLGGIRGNGWRLDLHRDSTNPRTAVKCWRMVTIGPDEAVSHGFQQFFHEVNSDSFTITMKLKFDP